VARLYACSRRKVKAVLARPDELLERLPLRGALAHELDGFVGEPEDHDHSFLEDAEEGTPRTHGLSVLAGQDVHDLAEMVQIMDDPHGSVAWHGDSQSAQKGERWPKNGGGMAAGNAAASILECARGASYE
jgi:hypothetical protein